jgi:hypothetical protein
LSVAEDKKETAGEATPDIVIVIVAIIGIEIELIIIPITVRNATGKRPPRISLFPSGTTADLPNMAFQLNFIRRHFVFWTKTRAENRPQFRFLIYHCQTSLRPIFIENELCALGSNFRRIILLHFLKSKRVISLAE